MRAIAVRHVRLVGEEDDIGRRQAFPNARQDSKAAQA
jgi:hypothetical protein